MATLKPRRGRSSHTAPSSAPDALPLENNDPIISSSETTVLIDSTDSSNHAPLDSSQGIILHRSWIPPLYISTLMPLALTVPIYTLPSSLYAVLIDDRVKWTTPPSPLLKENDRSASATASPPKMSVFDFLHSRELKPKNVNHVSKPRHYYKGLSLRPSSCFPLNLSHS